MSETGVYGKIPTSEWYDREIGSFFARGHEMDMIVEKLHDLSSARDTPSPDEACCTRM